MRGFNLYSNTEPNHIRWLFWRRSAQSGSREGTSNLWHVEHLQDDTAEEDEELKKLAEEADKEDNDIDIEDSDEDEVSG